MSVARFYWNSIKEPLTMLGAVIAIPILAVLASPIGGALFFVILIAAFVAPGALGAWLIGYRWMGYGVLDWEMFAIFAASYIVFHIFVTIPAGDAIQAYFQRRDEAE